MRAGGYAAAWVVTLADGSLAVLKVPFDGNAAALEAELKALRAVSGAGTPRAIDVVSAGGRPALLMELIDGPDLEEAAPTAPIEQHTLAIALAAALAHVHASGLVHADVKPGNVVLRDRRPDQPVLIDFGLAHRTDAPQPPGRRGTPPYMAPELWHDGPSTPATDVYALGILLCELFTGSRPFAGDQGQLRAQHLLLRPPRPRSRVALPRSIDRAIVACLAKDPAHRPAAATLASVLRAARDRNEPALPLAIDDQLPAVEVAPDAVAVLRVTLHDRPPRAALVQMIRDLGGFAVGGDGRGTVAMLFDDDGRDALAAALRLVGGAGSSWATIDPVATRVRWHRDGTPLTSLPATARPVRPGILIARSLAGRVRSGALNAVDDTWLTWSATGGDDVELIGRERELAALTAAIREPGAFVVLRGGPSLGKSRLLGEVVAELASDLDVQTIAGTQLRESVDVPAAPRPERALIAIDDAHRMGSLALQQLRVDLLAPNPPRVLAILPDHAPGWDETLALVPHVAFTLEPLPDEAGAALLAAALIEVSYPPTDLLRELVRTCGGSPATIVALARRLRLDGAIEVRDGIGRIDVERAQVSARREAGQAQFLELAGPLRRLAILQAVVAPRASRAQLRAIIDELEERGLIAGVTDPGPGLDGLLRLGVSTQIGVEHELSRDLAAALRAELPESVRVRLAEGAWSVAEDEGDAWLAIRLHLARMRGQWAESIALGLRAARQLRRSGDPFASATLLNELLPSADEPASAALLLERARARLATYAHRGASDDVATARKLAAGGTDPVLEARSWLDEAEIEDWKDDYARSLACLEQAERLLHADATVGAALAVEAALAHGRAVWRGTRTGDAVTALRSALVVARDYRADEAATVASLMLAPRLIRAGQLEEGERLFDEVIASCQRSGDRLHESAALSNRSWRHLARGDHEAARADLERAVAVARRIGHPRIERAAAFNLAEVLVQGGQLEEARRLALRSRFLRDHFLPHPSSHEEVLLLRIAALGGDREAGWLLGADLDRQGGYATETQQLLGEAARLALGLPATRSWVSLIEGLGAQPADVAAEVWVLRVLAEARAGTLEPSLLDAARRATSAWPAWRARVDELSPGGPP